MRTKLILFCVCVCAAALPLTLKGQRRQTRSANTNIDFSRPIADCKDIGVTYSRRPAITDEAHMTLAASQVAALRVQTSNSGMYLMGWDRNEYSVTTCKAVPADDSNPTATLRDIVTRNTGGTLTIDGPTDHEWMANLIIMVPRLSTMALQTSNGPLQLRDLAGNIQLRASNGPISLDNVGGVVEATTSNGPISLKGATGDQRVSATNGPVSVTLSGSRWDGPGLEVSTQNGPVSLTIPDSYASGIRIESSGRSPISCVARACAGAMLSGNSVRTMRIGDGAPLVRLSTSNGPLSIR